jgi:hypothetical protein
MTRYALVFVLAIYTLAISIRENKVLIRSTIGFIPAMAVQTAPYLKPGTVCARKPHIVWCLNEQFQHFPAFTFVPMPANDILQNLRKDRVDYVFLSPLEWQLRPETRPWFNPKNAPPDFVLIKQLGAAPVLLYAIDHSKSPSP